MQTARSPESRGHSGESWGRAATLALCCFCLGTALTAGAARAADDDLRRCTALAEKVPDTALEHCDRALASGAMTVPDSARAHLARAIAWRTKADASRAIDDLNEVLKLDPSNADALIMRGVAWQFKGEGPKAVADFDAAIQLRPDSNAYGARGDSWRRQGMLERALADYSEAIRLAPDRTIGYRARGAVRLEHGDFDLAADDFRQALQRSPKSTSVLRNLGIAQFLGAHFVDSADTMARAVQASPDDLHARLWLYLAQQRAGQAQAARENLRQHEVAIVAGSWPAPVGAYFLGKIDADRLEQDAAAADDPSARGQRRCEADFYMGENLMGARAMDPNVTGLAATDLQRVRSLLQSASEHCAPDTFHAMAARADLARLGSTR